MPQEALPALISLAAGPHQVPLIQAAQAAGLRVVAIDQNPSAPGLALADVALELSTHDAEAILRALRELEPLFDFKGLVHRTSGKALHTAALLREALELPGLSEEAALISTEKSALREFCGRHGIPMPRGVRVEDRGDLPFDLPVVVKPDFPTVGKLDVRRIARPQELALAIGAACASSFNGLAEVEEYIDGIDVSCLFWVSDQRATSIATYDELIGVAEDGSLLPFGISMPSSIHGHAAQQGIEEVIQGFAQALPDVQALLIVSMRLDQAARPHVIELHADLSGDRIAEELFPRAMPELNFFQLAVRMATGGELPSIAAPQGSHMLLYAGKQGCLGEEGLESEVLSATSLETNLDQLADGVLRCLRPVALAPRQITHWAKALIGSKS